MVTLTQAGQVDSIAAEMSEPDSGQEHLLTKIEPPPGQPEPWSLGRRVLEAARASLGIDVVEQAIAPDRGILALVLPELENVLSSAERAVRRRYSARRIGMLPSTFLRPDPMVDAWTRTLRRLAAVHPIGLIVPSLSSLEAESRRLLRPLCLGEDPRLGLVGGLDAAPSTTGDDGALDASLVLGGLERPCEVDLSPASMPEASPEEMLDAAWRAFDAYGLSTARRIATSALAGADGSTEPELHLVAGLASANLQGAEPRASRAASREAALHHLEAALDGIDDPRARTHVAYRLAMVSARGGDLEGGVLWTERAREELSRSENPFLAAWIHNAQAYCAFRSGQADEARQECTDALASLEQVTDQAAGELDLHADELVATKLFLNDNLGRMAQASGLIDEARERHARCRELDARLPADKRTPLTWFQQSRCDFESESTRYAALADRARRMGHDEARAHWLSARADIEWRRGDAVAAGACYQQVLDLALHSTAIRGCELPAQHGAAIAALRSGDLEDADLRLAQIADGPIGDDADALAELDIARAFVAALSGRADDALVAVDRLLADLESLAPDATVRSTRWAVETALAAGDPGRARRAAEIGARVARQASDAADGTGSGGIPPEDRLGLLVASLPLRPDDPTRVLASALALLPHALADANAWWDVPALAEALDGLDPRDRAELLRVPSRAQGATELEHARGQRLDCDSAAQPTRAHASHDR